MSHHGTSMTTNIPLLSIHNTGAIVFIKPYTTVKDISIIIVDMTTNDSNFLTVATQKRTRKSTR